MRRHYLGMSLILMCTLILLGCEAVTAPLPDTSSDADYGTIDALSKHVPIDAQATGGGQYDLPLAGEMFPGKFSFSAVQFSDASATGRLRFVLDLGDGIPDVIAGGVVEIQGDVTCVSAEPDLGRAWVGGVITQNRSTQPDFRDDPTTQVGKDVWFRVLDDGEGKGATDRTTFVGFEGGGGIITSQEYCDTQIWPDDNARTNPVSGNIQVHR